MGFAFAKMRTKMPTLKAALVLGVTHVFWHFGADYLGASRSLGAYWPVRFAAFCVAMLAMRIILVWVYVNTESLLMAQLMHASSTGSLGILVSMSILPANDVLFYVVYGVMLWGVAALLISKFGKDLLVTSYATKPTSRRDPGEKGRYEFHLPKWLLRLLKIPPQVLYKIGLGPVYGRFVLLLTTRGRKSGLPRTTPLQYETMDGVIYVASATGQRADWFRNILANPEVEVQVRNRKFRGKAETVTDPARIADFLALRRQRHPRMVGAMMRAVGLSARPTRVELEAYAANRPMVVIQPLPEKCKGGEVEDVPALEPEPVVIKMGVW
jgi:deazaflavin-dependent oxidoreductase (nitroreductase family)